MCESASDAWRASTLEGNGKASCSAGRRAERGRISVGARLVRGSLTAELEAGNLFMRSVT